LISRVLGPAKFSHFSIAISLGLILNRLNDFGLNYSDTKKVGGEKDQNKINIFLSICLKYRIILSIVITFLGVVFSNQIARFLKIENSSLIVVTFLTSLSVTYFEYIQSALQSLHLFNKSAFSYFLPSIFKFLLAILMFASYFLNVNWILAIYLLTTLPSIIYGEIVKPAWIRYDLLKVYDKEKGEVLKVLRHSAFAVIAAGIIENIDILFSKHFLSEYETGVLAGVTRIALIFYVIAYGLASVLNPRVAAYKEKTNMDKFLKKAWIILLLSMLGYFVVLPSLLYLLS
jgi:O-antigen/teichoic acid export membrane protein